MRLLLLKRLLLLLPRRLLRLTLLRWKPLLRAMLLLRPRRQLKKLLSSNLLEAHRAALPPGALFLEFDRGG
jgi:hypothetical protein